jgi:DNA-directed RNA polymerase I subunit RPA49
MSASTSTQEIKKGKRKSTAGGAEGGDVKVVLNEASTSAGPAFRMWTSNCSRGQMSDADEAVNFPSVRPSKATPYTVYSREIGSSKELARQRTCIAGETEDVEFFSLNRDYPSSEATDCQYVFAPPRNCTSAN